MLWQCHQTGPAPQVLQVGVLFCRLPHTSCFADICGLYCARGGIGIFLVYFVLFFGALMSVGVGLCVVFGGSVPSEFRVAPHRRSSRRASKLPHNL